MRPPATRTETNQAPPPALTWRTIVPQVLGAGLLIATGAIHLDLYLTGYRTIPTIGWLFLLQVIAAFALGLAVGAMRFLDPAAGPRTRLVAAMGAGFALATLGGYILSVWIGLFGFKEVRTTAGIVAGLIEVAAFAALAALALAPDGPALIPAAMTRMAGMAAGGLIVLALVLFGVSIAGASSSSGPAATHATLKTTTINGERVLTNAKGRTLYSFAPDTATTSKCYGSCATYWPPVTGKPTAGAGVTGKLGTIRRTDGSTQVTYDGHPLYTYVGDSAPGQDKGNNLNLNGGLWRIVPASG
jgi:predicted lipoprotein with Yx(FWY)xxD motif